MPGRPDLDTVEDAGVHASSPGPSGDARQVDDGRSVVVDGHCGEADRFRFIPYEECGIVEADVRLRPLGVARRHRAAPDTESSGHVIPVALEGVLHEPFVLRTPLRRSGQAVVTRSRRPLPGHPHLHDIDVDPHGREFPGEEDSIGGDDGDDEVELREAGERRGRILPGVHHQPGDPKTEPTTLDRRGDQHQ